MPKLKTAYVCQNCSFESLKWIGQCPRCNKWNTFVETILAKADSKSSFARVVGKGQSAQKLTEIILKQDVRKVTGIAELDRVLGGGFVPGQVVLLAGEPGIGKSTILLQAAEKFSLKEEEVLYVSGEESVEQIKIRAGRLKVKGANLLMLSETDVDSIISYISSKPNLSLVILDSIQTLTTTDLVGTAGSVGQVRECASRLSQCVKSMGIPCVMVGHVTKEGSIAGPKVLEHLVDTVLYIEGDDLHLFRLLRTTKNRFGPVSEVGIFEMSDVGLREVKNPSDVFLEERLKSAPGSCVTVVMEGFRPILLEIQALTTPTNFGYPKRAASGFNLNRLMLLVAVLEKRCNLKLGNEDVYVNVAGGMKISENSADLAVCLAIYSSLTGKSIDPKAVAFGEVGLSGEVRKITHMQNRAKEAKKLGFTKVIGPAEAKSLSQALRLISKG